MKIEAPTVKINGKVADANVRIATVKAPKVELSAKVKVPEVKMNLKAPKADLSVKTPSLKVNVPNVKIEAP